jgi:endonuclease/exonuclease/phosphatase family metal-dependent hydrolase
MEHAYTGSALQGEQNMTVSYRWLVAACAIAIASLIPGKTRGHQAPAAAPAKQPGQKVTQGSHRFGLDKPPPKSDGVARLATYNTLNLFDWVDDPTLQGEYDDLPAATPRERCARLADAIRAIDADIIALQEVESLDALRWFRDTFLADAGYAHLASMDVGYYRGVECSVMSRFPIVEQHVWLNESLDNVKREGTGWTPVPPDQKNITFQRSPLMVVIQVSPGYQLTILSQHHKAGPSFGWHREAEAIRINDIIAAMQAEDPHRNIVVMGDFNAAPWDKSFRTYLRNGMVDTLSYRLIDRESPESPLYKTHESDKVLDYILMNSAAFREYVPGSGFVYGTIAPPATYDYRNDPKPEGYASDHYPVVVDILAVDR